MSLKNQLKSDLDNFFNEDEFAIKVEYNLGTDSSPVVVQFFDEESGLGDSVVRKCICKYDEIQNLSKEGYFVIDGDRYGVLDFRPDEEKLLMQMVLQKKKG